MGYFKKTQYTDERGKDWDIYNPSIFRQGTIFIKGKENMFVKKILK